MEDYLTSGGESLRAFQQDVSLRELTETPLMLSILTLTYYGMPIEELLQGGIVSTRQQVFERYVERMLSRRGTTSSYSPKQTKGWLAWLARQMKQQNQTVFYIERMQPDWVSKNRRQQILSALITGLVSVLLFGLFSVLLFGSAGLLFGSQHSLEQVWAGRTCGSEIDKSGHIGHIVCSPQVSYTEVSNGTVQGGLTFALLFGLPSVLIGGVISLRKRSIQPVEVVKWQWTGRWRRFPGTS